MIYAAIIMIVVYILLYVVKYKNYSKRDLLLTTSLYFYVWLILFLTIIPRDFTINPIWQSIEPIKYPFENLKPYNDLLLGRSGSVIDVVLNLLMMIPFSFLFSSVNKNINVLEMAVTTFLFSLFIESVQLISTIFLLYGRNFDITDIINNTIGGIVGYIIYKLYVAYKNSVKEE